MKKFEGPVAPLLKQAIGNQLKHSWRWSSLQNGANGYQVRGPHGVQYAVDVRKKECSFRLGALSGIPCVHAIVALKEASLDPCEYDAECYKVDTFDKIYENVIFPVNMDQWPSTNMLKLDSPIPYAQHGW